MIAAIFLNGSLKVNNEEKQTFDSQRILFQCKYIEIIWHIYFISLCQYGRLHYFIRILSFVVSVAVGGFSAAEIGSKPCSALAGLTVLL